MYLVWKDDTFIAITNDEEDAQRLAAVHNGWYKVFIPQPGLSISITCLMNRIQE